MYLLNFPQFLGVSNLPTGVSTPPTWSTNVPMYLRNLQKNLVLGTLIEAEILTSPLCHVFAQLSPVFGCWQSAHRCVNTPKWSRNVPMCFRNLQKYLVHGALIEAEIMTFPLSHVFAPLGPVFGHQHSSHRCVSTSQVV